MCGVTLCIGLLTTCAKLGAAAPVLLIQLRVVQGIAVGGEWGGAGGKLGKSTLVQWQIRNCKMLRNDTQGGKAAHRSPDRLVAGHARSAGQHGGRRYMRRVALLLGPPPCALRGSGGARLATHEMACTVLPSGAIHLANEARVLSSQPSLARLGLSFQLALADEAHWYGCGPHESYPDRCASAHVGVHRATADELSTPYIYPSECGHRTGTRWLGLRTRTAALWVGSATKFGFSALRHSTRALAAAAVHLHLQDPRRSPVTMVLMTQRTMWFSIG